ncbi:hypothetical protein BAUCODRAFT_124644 [Baudoinia panamericana UAMH 10762]|uniref:Zn(2)-C6 fungal-type domain-containing protein n=1 Tax=Baudoinia panamericana (strain UAMH 10762) TaxID=717646 RepID=M2LIA4_BAUPA|nr:uncharacterized protein BAUCODRAFT_124644 [Baudoinia panamericana UAMH 10762]EMC93897.1 hypothetical protein BAUCODRAFT_124644 [Baudoinia panamericana UAMH 10762]
MSATSSAPSPKPGMACLGCRQRKLKCTREPRGCRNCTKSELPCIYPPPETGAKRKRGPYKKDKPARERHLEQIVKYLEPTNGTYSDLPTHLKVRRSTTGESNDAVSGENSDQEGAFEAGADTSELVKDALIALTTSSVHEMHFHVIESMAGNANGRPTQESSLAVRTTVHPPARILMEYWHLFVERVDPLTKIIHCPTSMKQLIAAADRLQPLESAQETLLFSIYYIAVSTCTADEARRRFHESRTSLLQRYGRAVELSLTNTYGTPTLEILQALVLYMIGIRRQDDAARLSAFFALAVRLAQMMGLNKDPTTSVRPFAAELRRRLWWHICGLESQAAEETTGRKTSIMDDSNVRLPANLNDIDLDPHLARVPLPRSGATDMTFSLIRFENFRYVHSMWALKRRTNPSEPTQRAELESLQRRYQARLKAEYEQYLDKSRPFDFLCLTFAASMMHKAKMMAEYPFGQPPTSEMSPSARHRLLHSSVAIIEATHLHAMDERLRSWHWFFRGYVQWHSMAIVVAELGRSTNVEFSNTAWAVLDPILGDWERMYATKAGEASWEHVNTLIVRAKYQRQQLLSRSIPDIAPTPASQLLNGDGAVQHGVDAASSNLQQAVDIGLAKSSLPVSVSMLQHIPALPFQSGTTSSEDPTLSCAPTAMDFELDFSTLNDCDMIDFQAFDAVFGNAWDLTDPFVNLADAEQTLDGPFQAGSYG